MKTLKKTLLLFTSLFCLYSCGIYDLRSSSIKKEGIQAQNVTKGKQVLEKAWRRQGMDKLGQFKTYSYHANDTWRGLLGNMGKVWKDNETELDFKFRVNSFDGQVTFLDGTDKGTSSGLQNWRFYDKINDEIVFSDNDSKNNRRKVFGISAYQYFAEMIDRLRNAPIISYIGEKGFRNQQYDVVFCTWDKPAPHMEHDQYVIWVNKATGLMDFVQYTIRDSYLKPPGYKKLGGAIEFADFREVNGVFIPHRHIVYAIKMRENRKHNLHELLISDFKFNSFDESVLKVDKELPLGTDSKK